MWKPFGSKADRFVAVFSAGYPALSGAHRKLGIPLFGCAGVSESNEFRNLQFLHSKYRDVDVNADHNLALEGAKST